MKIDITGNSSGVNTVGVLDSETKSANGAVIAGSEIVMQTADATYPGLVSTGAQSIAGNKTFTGSIAASNFSGSSSGTNTGDITLTSVGSSPNANAASLSGQQLQLQPASASFPGVVTTSAQTFQGAKTFGNEILAADGSNSAPGVAFSADPDSGLYRLGANDVGIAAG